MNPNKARYRTTSKRSLQNRQPAGPGCHRTSSGAQGRPKVYSDAAIQAILTLKVVFKLALRQAQGWSAVC